MTLKDEVPDSDKAKRPEMPMGSKLALDAFGCFAALLPDAFAIHTLESRNKDWIIQSTPPKGKRLKQIDRPPKV